jgi:hypothetical protein
VDQLQSWVRCSCLARSYVQRNGAYQSVLCVGIGLLMRFETIDAFGNAHGVDRGQSAAGGLVHSSLAQRLRASNWLDDGGGVSDVSHSVTLSETVEMKKARCKGHKHQGRA